MAKQKIGHAEKQATCKPSENLLLSGTKRGNTQKK